MADVSIPHFDFPFKFGKNHHAAVVQQDTEPDVVNCVHATVRTRKGTRYYVPTFGIDDPTFELVPLDLTAMQQQILESEPRAHMVIDQEVDFIRDFLKIQVGVDIPS